MTRCSPVLVSLLVVVGLVSSGAAFALDLVPGFGTVSTTGVAGGSVRATQHGNSPSGFCTGWIADAPSAVIVLDEDFARLRFAVSAPSDTTLVVLGPNGVRCNDDADGHNPAIEGAFEAGTYRVFVGSYDEARTIRFTLTVREG